MSRRRGRWRCFVDQDSTRRGSREGKEKIVTGTEDTKESVSSTGGCFLEMGGWGGLTWLPGLVDGAGYVWCWDGGSHCAFT